MIAIDVGYSHTKAVSADRRVIIPSVVAPYRELPLADLSGNSMNFMVAIRKLDGTVMKYFVGELALREGHGATFTLDHEKHKHPNHDILVLTAARLLDVKPGATLVAGLPVAYYRLQKEELRKHLEALNAEVSVGGSSFGRVSFGKVVIYPQGAGALLTVPALPSSGLILLIDVGYKTTDYIVAEVCRESVRPVSSLCGSIETGVHAVYTALAAEYQERTGIPLSTLRIPDVIGTDGKLFFYGREIDLSDTVTRIKANVAMNIADQVMAQLGDRAAFVRRTYLAGGGAEALPLLSSLFPIARVLPDAQWANACGFLMAVRQLKSL